MTARFVIAPDVCSATDKDGTTILSIERGKLYSVIGIGSLIWSQLAAAPSGLKVESIVDLLEADFSTVPRQRIEQDVQCFLHHLSGNGVVLLTDSNQGRIVGNAGWRLSEAAVSTLRLAVTVMSRGGLYAASGILLLMTIDIILRKGRFRALHRVVRDWPVARRRVAGHEKLDRICASVDRSCSWYLKQTLCLHRSAVAACMLRSQGIAAEMVIGCRKMPFQGHAWVEVDGKVVNDHQKVKEFYSILDRC
jgi:hypothetical protein